MSFRTPGGPDFSQIATMMWLYLLAFGALVSSWLPLNLCLLMAGYACMLVLDPLAAL